MSRVKGPPTASASEPGRAPRGHASGPALSLRPRPLRIALYVSLVVSLAATLFLEPALAGAVYRGALSGHWLFTAIGVYGVFFAVYAVDRLLLVKRLRYPAGKAFFQVAFALVFGLLLLPSTIRDYASRPAAGERLLVHPDSEIRLVAVEALFLRGPSRENVRRALERRRDPDRRVREAASRVLARWAGVSEEDESGIQAWASALSGTATVTRGERVP